MIRFFYCFTFFCFSLNSLSQTDSEFFIKAKIAEEYKKTDTAIIFISEALKLKKTALYYEERADLYLSMKNVKSALSDYLSASADGSNEIKYKIARCYSAMDSLSETITWLTKYLSEKNKIPEIIIRTDSVFKKINETNQWGELWRKNWYDNYENYIGDIYYLSVNNKFDEIYEVLDSALLHYPDKPELWLWRAKAFSYGNNPKEAMKSLDNAIKFDPSRVDVLGMRADLLRKTGKSKKAVTDYSSILEIQPWNVKYIKERGNAKMEAEDFANAVSDFLEYYKYDSLDVNSLYMAAKATYLKTDVNEALKLFSKCIEKNSGKCEYYFERGKCYYDLLDNEKAYSDFCMAIDLRPNVGEYFYYRGLTYYALKNKTGACHDWEKAQSLDYLKAQDYMLRYCAN